jgi:hypothetical protein
MKKEVGQSGANQEAAQLQEKFRRLIKNKSCETSWPRSRNRSWMKVSCLNTAIFTERELDRRGNNQVGMQSAKKDWQQGRAGSGLLELSRNGFAPVASDVKRTGLLKRRSKRLAPPTKSAERQTRIETCRHPLLHEIGLNG